MNSFGWKLRRFFYSDPVYDFICANVDIKMVSNFKANLRHDKNSLLNQCATWFTNANENTNKISPFLFCLLVIILYGMAQRPKR